MNYEYSLHLINSKIFPPDSVNPENWQAPAWLPEQRPPFSLSGEVETLKNRVTRTARSCTSPMIHTVCAIIGIELFARISIIEDERVKIVAILITILALSTLMPRKESCSNADALAELRKNPLFEALWNKATQEQQIEITTLSQDRFSGVHASNNAHYVSSEHKICISEGNKTDKMLMILFEAANAFQQKRFRVIEERTKDGTVTREEYTLLQEWVEYHSLLMHHTIAEYGVRYHGWAEGVDEYRPLYQENGGKFSFSQYWRRCNTLRPGGVKLHADTHREIWDKVHSGTYFTKNPSLFQKQPQLFQARDSTGKTLLHLSIELSQSLAVFEALLKKSEVDACTTKGNFTPLGLILYILSRRLPDFADQTDLLIRKADLLLEQGANVNLPTSEGETPLGMASRLSEDDRFCDLINNLTLHDTIL
jgi:hypothetical protein